MVFEPIAIVGRACVLPGALSPDELGLATIEGRDLISGAPAGRWGVAPHDILCAATEDARDRTWSDRGGYVKGFDETFDPAGFELPSGEVSALDPLFQWIFHCGREALTDAGYRGDRQRVGAIFGNLSFPTVSANRFAEAIWLRRSPRPHARNRFSSGLPALLLERALAIGGGAFALDAACASSLYAIKLACDRLHDGAADLMLAGAVNSTDDLFIHVGFAALQALSLSGRSRPFHASADGLVPAEGAALVALRRLSDAVRDGDRVHGVIRGIGLSNDGRGRGMLVPAEEGQARAIRAAYVQAGLEPLDVSLLECHATGTQVGDATEARSVMEVLRERRAPTPLALPIGSLKSNLGHLVTVAGAAGLIKVLEAMRRAQRPATLHADEPAEVLEGAPLRLLQASEPWDQDGQPRRAAISAFGFGGNNAHLVVEEPPGGEFVPARRHADDAPRPDPCPVAIVAIGVMAPGCGGRAAFTEALLHGATMVRSRPDGDAAAPIESVELSASGLRFPPNDLKEALPQQLLMLAAALEAADEAGRLPRDRTGVMVGMGADAEIGRYGLRWRLAELMDGAGQGQAPWLSEWAAGRRDAVVAALTAAGVLGTMPNIPANRLNRQLDLGGPSFTLSEEEHSGMRALELAVRALAVGELDAALVGAVDLSCEPVHLAAVRELLPADRHTPGDAAVALVLKRLDDARCAGDHVYAVVVGPGEGTAAGLRVGLAEDHESLVPRFGHAHAASGLLHVAAAALALRHGVRLDGTPWLTATPRVARVAVAPMDGGARAPVVLREDPAGVRRAGSAGPYLLCFSGATKAEVLARLVDAESEPPARLGGPCRLVVVVPDRSLADDRLARARRMLESGAPGGAGIHFRAAPVTGELALVFTAAGAAYPGMGRELLQAFPELGDRLAARFPSVGEAMDWVWGERVPSELEMLWGASALCQIHAELSLGELALRPAATIGYSSGESNALFALGVWRDMESMRADMAESGLFSRHLGGTFEAVARAWGEERVAWEVWSLLAPVARVREAVAEERRVHLSIVHSAEDCVIAGDTAACARVVARIGRDRSRRLPYNLAVHVPELGLLPDIEELWLDVHRRAVAPPSIPGVRVYTSATHAPLDPTSEGCARAILGQADRTLDFPRTVERAWLDGVRVFVEHGPQAACGGFIAQILGERRHEALIVSLDRRGRGILPVYEAVAELLAGGVAVGADFLARCAPPAPAAEAVRLVFPAHAAPVPVLEPPLGPPTSADPFYDRVTGTTPDPSVEQTMAPAPGALVSEASAPRVAAAAIDPAPAAARMTPPTERRGLPPAELARIHQDFLTRQAAVHARFLEVRRQLAASIETAPPVRTSLPLPVRPPEPVPVPVPVRIPTPTPTPTDLSAPATPIPGPPPPKGPTFDRAGLLVHASGNISEIFGPAFAGQDGFARQVRMPEPPLLLADRVTGLDAQPGVLGKGTIWTETDVAEGAWYLNDGYLSPGLMIESGQADLMLISYMGVDAQNRSERVYRLLGCELTYHDGLPRPGDTLCYDIHVDDHARQGDVRLFFFHYDCHVGGKRRLSVRHGQAGFFTDAELAESAGVLWKPEEATPCAGPRLDPPAVSLAATAFDAERVRAFSEGRPWDCFGPAFDRTRAHVRTPRIQPGKLLLIERVTDLDVAGGAWGRGYLRGETELSPDDWFFSGHFKNDPCMPGTLMFEACFQAMAFYLAALGHTIDRDGWRFQPVVGEPFQLRCRGQATPASRRLVYEVFVEEVVAGPVPKLYADLLCTVDGLKAFHARRVGLELVPDWPLTSRPEARRGRHDTRPVAVARHAGQEVRFDYPSLLACAWGRPSDAFGSLYTRFDGPRRVARLPGPPYHFMSRITRVDGEMGKLAAGVSMEAEYDVPEDAWYFDENGAATMPYCVLLEAALQPCGWLASYLGSTLLSDEDLSFRNLDGTGKLTGELFRDAGTLRTTVTITNVSRTAGLIIESFDVACYQGDRRVYEMQTVFGFFPAAAFENQVGLPTTDAERTPLLAPGGTSFEMRGRASAAPLLARGRLLMLDRVTGFWPAGGAAGLGLACAEKVIDPGEWFFKAHFFQDPVQPGSLGIEAMVQLLQVVMVERGMADGIPEPRFEPLALDQPLTWKYRGQVLPTNEKVQVTLEVTEVGEDERARFARADSSLWVDGKRIYHAKGLGMRIVAGGALAARGAAGDTVTLDPSVDTWLADHRPTHNRPALPMMSIIDLLAAAVPGPIRGLRSVKVNRWVDFDGPRRIRVEREARGDRVRVRLLAGGDAVPVAEGVVITGAASPAPAPWAPLAGAEAPSPYESGELFHGPAFQVLRRLVRGEHGASSLLDAGAASVPVGRLHPALLDGALHGIPHDRLELWNDAVPHDHVGYPSLVTELDLFGPVPTRGMVACEVRADGQLGDGRFPAFRIQLAHEGRVFVELRLVEACFPKGPLGRVAALDRRAFLRDHHYVPGVRLSRAEGGVTRLSAAEVARSDWMPGTIEGIYGTTDVATIALKEHLAARAGLHPRILPEALPLERPRHRVALADGEATVQDLPDDKPDLLIEKVGDFWGPVLGAPRGWLGEDLFLALLDAFVGRVVLHDPAAFASLAGRPAIFVGNHQVQIESLLVTNLIPVLTGTLVTTMANAKHERGWIGQLLRLVFSYPGCRDPENIVYFDPEQPGSMKSILAGIEAGLRRGDRSFFVHTEGTRARCCREEVTRISSAFLDLALSAGVPIVPVRFAGGLPVERLEPVGRKLEFPAGCGRQDYHFGRPMEPAELAALSYAERPRAVLAAMNALGTPAADEQPASPSASLEGAVARLRGTDDPGEVAATLRAVLAGLRQPGADTRRLLAGELADVGGSDARNAWFAAAARWLGLVTS